MNKSLEEIKAILELPEVREIIQSEIEESVKTLEAELSGKLKEIEESKKAFDKETFITKKMLIAKANLYEKKLQEFYQNSFVEAKQKLATEVFAFVQDNVHTLVKSIQEDAEATTQAAKLQEAFSEAVRAMAPHMNINELVSSKADELEKMKARLNDALAENKVLKSEKLSEDIQALIVNETTGYEPEVRVAITAAIKKMSLKTMAEAKEAITSLKQAIKKQKEQPTAKEEKKEETKETQPVTEGTTKPAIKSKVEKDSKKLDEVVEKIKESKEALVEENKKGEKNSFKELRIPDYDIV